MGMVQWGNHCLINLYQKLIGSYNVNLTKIASRTLWTPKTHGFKFIDCFYFTCSALCQARWFSSELKFFFLFPIFFLSNVIELETTSLEMQSAKRNIHLKNGGHWCKKEIMTLCARKSTELVMHSFSLHITAQREMSM